MVTHHVLARDGAKELVFFFMVSKGIFTEWHEWHDRRITERLMDEIKRTIK